MMIPIKETAIAKIAFLISSCLTTLLTTPISTLASYLSSKCFLTSCTLSFFKTSFILISASLSRISISTLFKDNSLISLVNSFLDSFFSVTKLISLPA